MILNNVNGSRYVKLEKQYAYLQNGYPQELVIMIILLN